MANFGLDFLWKIGLFCDIFDFIWAYFDLILLHSNFLLGSKQNQEFDMLSTWFFAQHNGYFDADWFGCLIYYIFINCIHFILFILLIWWIIWILQFGRSCKTEGVCCIQLMTKPLFALFV